MQEQQDRAVGSTRTWEIVVAVAFFIFGAVVAWESNRIGSSWAPDGPQAGYFPFYIGVIICISAVAILVTALNSGAAGDRAFVNWSQLRMVVVVLAPSVVYVALIRNPVLSLGIYAASAIFIASFMRVLGKYEWGRIVPVSLGVPIAFFLMFEVWFKVPLPKGPLEALIGFE
jgi:putative tricarboxylic transport membrane protein